MRLVNLLTHMVAITALVALAGACSVNPVPEVPGPKDSYVYGYIDMSDAPTDLEWVSLRQYAPPSKEPYWSFWTNDGIFFNWYIDPGSYGVDSFGGSGFQTRYTFNIPRQMRSLRLVIKKPGLYYLGAYKYKNIKTGFFEPGKFDIKKIKKPTEREVVEKLLVIVKGTAVEPKLQKRLKELK